MFAVIALKISTWSLYNEIMLPNFDDRLANSVNLDYKSQVVRKPVFGVSDQVRHKPGCTAKEDG